MKEYVVSVTKTLCKKVRVSALNEQGAIEQAWYEYLYNSDDYDSFHFDEDKDLVGVDFKICDNIKIVDGRY